MSVTTQDVQQGRLNDELGSQLESLSARVEANLENGRNAWADWKARASDCTRRTTSAADNLAPEKPWQMICAATLFGVIAGSMCGMRHGR